jgi:hypothetical protein
MFRDLHPRTWLSLKDVSALELSARQVLPLYLQATLDSYADKLRASAIQYRRIDGRTSDTFRQAAVTVFQQSPEVRKPLVWFSARSAAREAAVHVLCSDCDRTLVAIHRNMGVAVHLMDAHNFMSNPAVAVICQVRVLLLSARAAGVGLSLTAASAVLFAELEWVSLCYG